MKIKYISDNQLRQNDFNRTFNYYYLIINL